MNQSAVELAQINKRHANKTVFGHLPELRHFVFPKIFLCFRVMIRIRVRVRIRFRVRVCGDTFKYVFGQISIRASVLDPNRTVLSWRVQRQTQSI